MLPSQLLVLMTDIRENGEKKKKKYSVDLSKQGADQGMSERSSCPSDAFLQETVFTVPGS